MTGALGKRRFPGKYTQEERGDVIKQSSQRVLTKEDYPMERTNIALNDDTRKAVSDELNKILSAEQVLYAKTRNYHWNVVGPQFHSLHLLFEEQYTLLAESIDEIAERIRSLGYNAMGTMAEYLKNSNLEEEKPNTYPNAGDMVARLVEGHENNIRTLREKIDMIDEECNDQGTADFLTAKMEEHEKMAWMLRAFLAGESTEASSVSTAK